jgi:hypothetical protein
LEQDSGQEFGCRIDAYIDGVGTRSDGTGVADGSGVAL